MLVGELDLNMFKSHVLAAWLGAWVDVALDHTRVKGTGGVARHHHHFCSPNMCVTTHDILYRVGVHACERGAMP
jgi:hypothetical protein